MKLVVGILGSTYYAKERKELTIISNKTKKSKMITLHKVEFIPKETLVSLLKRSINNLLKLLQHQL